MKLTRWTPLTLVAPSRYIETGDFWEEFDLDLWAREQYDWVQDPWNGFLDIAKEPSMTVEDDEGDCEDFALVAISWAVANDRDDIGLGFCWKTTRPWPTHAIAFDATTVYSSGDIMEISLDSWLANSPYQFAVRRRVSV